MSQRSDSSGFTLIELSIVLVILGLLAGGVLVGRDLIAAAAIRAQISQIQKYQTAVNVFKIKYGSLPGDMGPANATLYGFALGWSTSLRGLVAGLGDENGLIEGLTNMGQADTNAGYAIGAGEPVTFWSDLSYANGMRINLIEGTFNASSTANPALYACTLPCGNATAAPYSGAMPESKFSNVNFIYAYSVTGTNYFGLSRPYGWTYWNLSTNPGITVAQAAAIDQKVDDGFPVSGGIVAQYINSFVVMAGTASSSVAVGGSATTCYDNSGVATNPIVYSIMQNRGSGINCALSFKFQ